ncbi:hypothetical protein E0Z10_g3480 [Xylaria hypoxylon]|uniref:AA1-like domain-containing protein n=1 Tax=Xylaria hypoxylon TaxID=37992 RepID=A0A4Z0Z1L7_9PEZI|nr:hypothetical protein E0Z10_g3480 [Xylaria hypoxylon]
MRRMLFTSLRVLLWVQAVAAIPPAGHDTPLCSARSEGPSMFSIKNIAYSLRNPPIDAHLQLEVTNPATNYTTRCNLDGPQLTPGSTGKGSVDDMWTPCENRTVVPGEERYYTVDTDVLFDRNSKLLVINQTWYCDDVNPEYPTSGQMVEQCTAPDSSVSIYQYWRDDLPPDALENPIPAASSVP